MSETSLIGLPDFLAYFAGGLGFLVAFLRIYAWITPYDDIALIREGNRAAAISLGGALLGFALPLARVVEQSYGPLDFFVWTLIALLTQALTFFLVHRVFPNFRKQILAGREAEAILLAAISIAVGLLNAAAMTE